MSRTERQLAKQRQEVRSLGLKKLIVGGAASVLMLLWLMSGKPSASGGAFKLILFALPLVVAMMGFLETSSGVPFSRFSEAWDELQGWQRGVLGVAIFVVAVGDYGRLYDDGLTVRAARKSSLHIRINHRV